MKMFFVSVFVSGLIALSGFADVLDVEYGAMSGVASVSSSLFADAMTVNYVMPHEGAALVIATYSAATGGGGNSTKTGSWQLSGSGGSSSVISRSLSGSNDRGIATSMHVFSGLGSGANSVSLQHSTSDGTLETSGANVVVIPLVTSSGAALNYGMDTSGTQAITSQAYGESGLLTTVTVNRSTGNGMYIATSFNTQGSGSVETFSSQLQYRVAGSDDEWVNIGAGNRRYLSGASDTGSITLYGAVEDLASGSYEVRVAVKTADGNSVTLSNGELAAVATSYTDESGGGYFELYGATSAGDGNDSNDFQLILGAEDNVVLTENSDVFASMSFGGYAENGANQTAEFRLSISDENGVLQSTVENTRQFVRDYDYGSGGAVGVFTDLDAGTYTVYGEHDELNGATYTENITLVGFSTQAIPEPATILMVVLSSLGILFFRRRFLG
jgi:hypothetical protein